LVGSGCVVHLPGLFKELKSLEEKDLPNARERLFISDRAHVVLDLHQRVDGLEEAELAGGKIGTTGKGIVSILSRSLVFLFTVLGLMQENLQGPTYSTKASRSGIRIADIFREDLFEDKVRKLALVPSHILYFFPSRFSLADACLCQLPSL